MPNQPSANALVGAAIFNGPIPLGGAASSEENGSPASACGCNVSQ